MKSRFARTLLLLGALLSAGVLLSVVGTRARTRPSSAQPPSAVSAYTTQRSDQQLARGLSRRAAHPLPNPFDFRAASATRLWSAAMAPAVVMTIVNYDFNSGTSYSGLTPMLASGVLSGASSTEPFVTFSPGTATNPAAFTANATAGVALGMNNSSGANTRYFQFTLGGSSLAIYNSYKVYVQAQRSTTGAQTLTLAYSTDGTNFTNFPTTLTVPDGSFAAQVFDLSLISALNHKGTVVFRLLAGGASGTGTLRIDNFQVQANSVPLAGTPSVAANKTAMLATGGDVNGNGFVNPGDTLMYSVVVSNGGTDAMNVVFTDQLNPNLTLVGTANASPIGVNDSYSAIGNVGINVPDGASDLLANDVDPNGNAVTISGVVGCADATAPFVCTTANGGNITVQANGAFSYNSAPGFEGGDFFAYIVSDGQSPVKTDTANVTINVNELIWFIDNSQVTNGDGRLGTPFNSIPNFNAGATDEAGDIIFIYRQSPNDYTNSSLTLLPDQKLIGQGSTASLATSFTPNLVVPPFSNPLPATGGTRPTLTNTNTNVTVSTGNTIRGVNIQNTTAGSALLGTSFNNLTISETTISSSSGAAAAVNLDQASGTAAINVSFISVAASSTTNGIILRDTTGSFTITGSGGNCTLADPTCTGGTIQNTTGDGMEFNNVQNISLTRTRILNAGRQGLWGRIVNGFSLLNSINVGAGDGDEESAILFENDATTSAVLHTGTPLNGTFTIQDVQIDSPTQWGVRFHQLNGTMNLTVTRLLVQNNINTFGEQGFTFRQETGTANVLIDDSDFLNVDSHIDGGVQGSGTLNMTIQNTVVNQSQALPFGINFVTGSTGTGRLKATGNTLTGCSGGAGQLPTNMCSLGIDLDASVGSTLEATIQNNTINNAGIGGGLEFIVNDNAIGRANISDNNITVNPGRIGMNFQARTVLPENNETGQLHLTIEGNTISGINTAFLPGFAFATGASGSSPTHANLMCVNLDTPAAGGNIVNGTTGTDVYAYTFRQRTGTTFQIQGLTGSGTDRNNVQSFINAQHGGGTLGVAPPGSDAPNSYTDVFGAGGTTIVNYTNGTCQTPSMPALPTMMMAELSPRQSDRLFRSGHHSEVAEFFNAPFGTEPLWLKYATTPAQSKTVSITVSSPQAARWQHRLRPIFSAFTTPVSYSNVGRLTNWLAPAATAAEINSDEAAATYGTPGSPSANTAATTTSPRTMLVNSRGEYRIVPTAALAGELITINGAGSGFLLPAGESTTVMFNATINPSFTGTAITNQASVSGTGFGPILSNNLSTDVIQPPVLSKAFASPFVNPNGTVNLTFTLTNPNPNQGLTAVTFNDVLPMGLGVADGTQMGCGGTVTRTAATRTIALTGGSIAAGGNCMFTVAVIAGATDGTFTNTTGAPDSLQSDAGVPTTANINVIAPPTLSKSFTPNAIPVNGTSTLQFTLSNPNTTLALNTLTFTDTLPAGVTTPDVGATTVCGDGSYSITSNVLTFTKPSLAAGQNCQFSITVTGATAGQKTNTTSTVTTANSNAGAAATAMLEVIAPPTVTKSFAASPIPVGTNTTMSFLLTNPNASTSLTGVGFQDALPAGITVVSAASPQCGGTVTTTASSVTFSGGTLGTGGSATCTVNVTVTGAQAGSWPNTATNVVSTEGGAGANSNTATLVVLARPTVAKSFTPATITPGGTSLLTLTLGNANAVALTGAAITDTLPANVTTTAALAQTTCAGGTASKTANSVGLTGGTIPAGGTCTLTVNVTSSTSGVYTNTIAAGDLTTTNGGSNTVGAMADLIVASPPTVTKAFAPTEIPLGGTSTVTITLTNPNATADLTGATITDTLPANVTTVSGTAATTCGSGTASQTAGSVSLSGGTIPMGNSCTLTVNVTSATAGIYSNTIAAGDLTTSGGANTTGASATLSVVAPPTVSKAFAPGAIATGGTSTVTITLTNPNTTVALTGAALTDLLPAGVTTVGSTAATTCSGGTASQTANSVSLTGGTIPANNSCTLTVNVTSATAGSYANTIAAGDLTTTNGGSNAAGTSATLNVFGPPTVVKSFSPTSVALGGVSTLSITITNPAANPGGLSGLSFTDTFPAGLEVDATPAASNTCGGSFAPSAGAISISLTGGAIATAGNSCTVSVNVKGTTTGPKVNNVTVNSTEGGASAQATATLIVGEPPGFSKSFAPAQIKVSETSTLTFNITNPSGTQSLTGIQFNDPLPAGVEVDAAPMATNNGCGGTFAPVAGATSVSFSGGTLAASGSCSLSVKVKATTFGVKDNVTGQISATESGAGGMAMATLTVVGPPNLTKSFAPNPIVFGQTSTLSFTITNPNTTVGLSGISFNDVLPAGLSIADSPATAACGGSYTVTAATRTIAFSGGTLTSGMPGNTCTFSVTVTGQAVGAQVNTTSPVTSTEGGTATGGATATLTVNKADTTTVITSDLPDPSTCGQVVTVTYTVTPLAPGTGTPTGTVMVTDGVNSCTDTIAAGQCSLTLTTFGNRTLTASYSGDGNFNGSTSAGVPHQVADTTAPVITCPANQVGVTNISAPNAPVPVNYPAPTVSDACTGATVNCVPPSGSNFPLGTTTVNCTASDAASNTAACSFTVTVRQPSPALKDLIARFKTLVPPLTQAQANGLIGHLELANTRVQQGQIAQACTHMLNFVNGVTSLTPPLSAAQNQFLISYANKIRNALNCAGGPFPTFRAETVGLYLAEQGEFKLKNRLTSGPAELSEAGGAPEDQPVAGDWDGDGIDTIGVYRQGVFYLRNTGGWAAAPGEEEARLDKRAETVVAFGQAGDVAVVGDWNGDGIDTIGVFRSGQFLLRNSNTAGEPELVINLGQAGDLPLAGDWDGDGTVTVGIYNAASGVFRLRNGQAEGAAEVLVLWGGVDYLPLVGDWDGDGVTTIGLYSRTGEFLLRNTNAEGPAEIAFTLGLVGGIPLAGDWDGLP